MKANQMTIAEKLEQYIVLTHIADDEHFYITNRSNFSTVNECDTYEKYGQQSNCENSGCYSFANSYSLIASDCIDELQKKYPTLRTFLDDNNISDHYFCESFIDDAISIEDITEEFDFLLISEAEAIKAFILQYKADNELHTEATAWDYWDGSNWKSVIIKSECGYDCDWSEADTDTQTEILDGFNGALDVFQGATESETINGYTYTTTRYSNDPWLATVIKE